MVWNLKNGSNFSLDLLNKGIGNEMYVQFIHECCICPEDIEDRSSLIGHAGILHGRNVGRILGDVRTGSYMSVSTIGYMRKVEFRNENGEKVEVCRKPGYVYVFRLDEILNNEEGIIVKGFGGEMNLKEAMFRPDFNIEVDIHPKIFDKICYHGYGTFPYIRENGLWKSVM